MEQKKTMKTMKQQLSDIDSYMWWGSIAHDYFGKSQSWLSRKLRSASFDGVRPSEFTEEEKVILKGALIDIANRLRRVADNIE